MKNIKSYNEVLNESGRSTNVHRQIFKAARTGDVETVKNLLDLGADIQAVDGDTKHTLLHRAANSGKVEVVKLLLDRGAPVDALDHFGDTPLITAAGAGRLAIVKLLLNADANPNAANVYGWTALQTTDSTAVANLLLDAGANVNQTNNNGGTALHRAIKYDWNKPLIELLIKRGANIDVVNNDGQTPLGQALKFMSNSLFRHHGVIVRDLMKFLIMLGANPFMAFKGVEELHAFFDDDTDWFPEDLKQRIRLAKRSQKMFGM